MSSTFTTGQIARLHQIEQARLRDRSRGIHDEVQELIRRLESGGVSPGTQPPSDKRRKGSAKLPPRDPRIIQQAKCLWNKGWGQRLGKTRFEEYLLDIPEIPTFPQGYDERFSHLVLVDRRIQVVEACQMLNVSFGGDSNTFVPHDEVKSVTTLIYWMRCQDGKAHRHHKPSDCRVEFSSHGDEFGLEAHEGLALYAQFPDLLEVGAVMDLPGSVYSDRRALYAYLRRWVDVDVRLDWRWYSFSLPRCGSASRGDCVR